jgi:DNA-binding HxlR family transcriptional regulator
VSPVKSYRQFCSVAKALDVVGDRWNLLIVRELLLQGPCRYTDLRHGLPGIATNLLTERLRELEAAGIVERNFALPPVATTLISLTATGEELRPVIDELASFGARYIRRSVTETLRGEADGQDVFRSHWLTYPVAMFCSGADSDEPDVRIEVRTGDRPVVIERAGGKVAVQPAVPGEGPPDLIVEGTAPLVVGLLAGLSIDEARNRGLRAEGDESALAKLVSRTA